MQDQVAQVKSSLLLFPEVTLQALGEDEITLDSVLRGKFAPGKSGFGWLACGPHLEIVSTITGERLSAYRFSGVTEQPPTVLAVKEFSWQKRTGLLVGIEETEGSVLCLYDLGLSRVVKAVVLPGRVTAIEPIINHGGASASTQHLHQSLRWFFGVAAVVTDLGHVLLVDLCLDDLSCSHDEMEASDLEVMSGISAEIPQIRENVTRQRRHLGLQLLKPSGNPVTTLCYIARTNQLAVGFSTGYLSLWNMKSLKRQYHCLLEGGRVPVYAVSFQEPENDPRNCCYLWAVQSTQESEGDLVSLHLLQMAFGDRRYLASGQILYEGLEYCEERYSLDLTGRVFSLRNQTSNTRLLGCQTVERFRSHGERDDSLNEAISPDTSVCFFSWQVNIYGQGKPSTYLAVFDINRWYHAQMPDSLRPGEFLHNCPYFTLWSLDAVVTMTSPHYLLDILVHERSLSRGMPSSYPPPEQFFNPSTYNFDGTCLLNSGVVHVTCTGLQKGTLHFLKKSGPFISDTIPDVYNRCLVAGLLSPRLADVHPSGMSQEDQLHAVLSAAVGTCSLGLLTGSIKQWTAEEQPSSAANLRFILEWTWNKVVSTKEDLDRLCASLFDGSCHFIGSQTMQSLQHCHLLLGNLRSILNCFLTEAHDLTKKGFIDLTNKKLVANLIFQYAQVVLWFCRAGLLPEASDIAADMQLQRPTYDYYILQNYYMGRRQKLERLSSGKWNSDCLMIDGMLSQCGDWIANLWSRDEGGTGKYPPVTLHALLDIYLLENVDETMKHAITIYLLLDIIYSIPNKAETAMESFPTAFALPWGLVKLIQGFWLLDHNDHQNSLDGILHPATSRSMLTFHHTRIIHALMCQGEHQQALRYIQITKPPLTSSSEVTLHLTVLLYNRSIVEAMNLVRLHSTRLNVKDLLRQLYEACQEMRLMEDLLKLPFTDIEQECLETFLQTTGGVKNQEFLLVHHLQRANYISALKLNQTLKGNLMNEREPHFRERADARNSILDQYGKVLPRVQMRLAAERAKPYSLPSSALREVSRPTPLSTVVKQSTRGNTVSKATFINQVLTKIRELSSANEYKEVYSPYKSINNEETMLQDAFVGTPITKASQKMSRLLTSVVRPVPQSSPEFASYQRTPIKTNYLTVSSPLLSKKRTSGQMNILKATEFSLLETPLIVRRAKALSTCGGTSGFPEFTPQSILRSNLRTTPIVSPCVSPGRSITPPLRSKETKITFVEQNGSAKWTNGTKGDCKTKLLLFDSPALKSFNEIRTSLSNGSEKVPAFQPCNPVGVDLEMNESSSSVPENSPSKLNSSKEISNISAKSDQTNVEFHDAHSPGDFGEDIYIACNSPDSGSEKPGIFANWQERDHIPEKKQLNHQWTENVQPNGTEAVYLIVPENEVALLDHISTVQDIVVENGDSLMDHISTVQDSNDPICLLPDISSDSFVQEVAENGLSVKSSTSRSESRVDDDDSVISIHDSEDIAATPPESKLEESEHEEPQEYHEDEVEVVEKMEIDEALPLTYIELESIGSVTQIHAFEKDDALEAQGVEDGVLSDGELRLSATRRAPVDFEKIEEHLIPELADCKDAEESELAEIDPAYYVAQNSFSLVFEGEEECHIASLDVPDGAACITEVYVEDDKLGDIQNTQSFVTSAPEPNIVDPLSISENNNNVEAVQYVSEPNILQEQPFVSEPIKEAILLNDLDIGKDTASQVSPSEAVDKSICEIAQTDKSVISLKETIEMPLQSAVEAFAKDVNCTNVDEMLTSGRQNTKGLSVQSKETQQLTQKELTQEPETPSTPRRTRRIKELRQDSEEIFTDELTTEIHTPRRRASRKDNLSTPKADQKIQSPAEAEQETHILRSGLRRAKGTVSDHPEVSIVENVPLKNIKKLATPKRITRSTTSLTEEQTSNQFDGSPKLQMPVTPSRNANLSKGVSLDLPENVTSEPEKEKSAHEQQLPLIIKKGGRGLRGSASESLKPPELNSSKLLFDQEEPKLPSTPRRSSRRGLSSVSDATNTLPKASISDQLTKDKEYMSPSWRRAKKGKTEKTDIDNSTKGLLPQTLPELPDEMAKGTPEMLEHPPSEMVKDTSRILEHLPEEMVKDTTQMLEHSPEEMLNDNLHILKHPAEAVLKENSQMLEHPPEVMVKDTSQMLAHPPEPMEKDTSQILDHPPDEIVKDISQMLEHPTDEMLKDTSHVLEHPPDEMVKDTSHVLEHSPDEIAKDASQMLELPPEEMAKCTSQQTLGDPPLEVINKHSYGIPSHPPSVGKGDTEVRSSSHLTHGERLDNSGLVLDPFDPEKKNCKPGIDLTDASNSEKKPRAARKSNQLNDQELSTSERMQEAAEIVRTVIDPDAVTKQIEESLNRKEQPVLLENDQSNFLLVIKASSEAHESSHLLKPHVPVVPNHDEHSETGLGCVDTFGNVSSLQKLSNEQTRAFPSTPRRGARGRNKSVMEDSVTAELNVSMSLRRPVERQLPSTSRRSSRRGTSNLLDVTDVNPLGVPILKEKEMMLATSSKRSKRGKAGQTIGEEDGFKSTSEGTSEDSSNEILIRRNRRGRNKDNIDNQSTKAQLPSVSEEGSVDRTLPSLLSSKERLHSEDNVLTRSPRLRRKGTQGDIEETSKASSEEETHKGSCEEVVLPKHSSRMTKINDKQKRKIHPASVVDESPERVTSDLPCTKERLHGADNVLTVTPRLRRKEETVAEHSVTRTRSSNQSAPPYFSVGVNEHFVFAPPSTKWKNQKAGETSQPVWPINIEPDVSSKYVYSPPAMRTRRKDQSSISDIVKERDLVVQENADVIEEPIVKRRGRPAKSKTKDTRSSEKVPWSPPPVQINLISPFASPATEEKSEAHASSEEAPEKMTLRRNRKRLISTFTKPVTRRKMR
ncbi:protein ELYS isoform X2 [Ambystoma mexicanum]|uniref:protein ELYS isoform X2 n=1 Tax=Ambystoma mexicanum TaxID=8296 RepID=UPI0037E779A0